MPRISIRRTKTRNTSTGEAYFTHRLVRSERVGKSVQQRTLLNLGRHFEVPQPDWPLLSARLDQLLAAPGSEPATHRWLGIHSALGELLDVDFETMSLMQLYRTSDRLMAHRETIERHLFHQVAELFVFETTITLYDLTNTCFEGEARVQPKAQRGRSKEKRSDCPLLTLGLVWPREQGYRYLVVSREHKRQFDPAQATVIETASQQQVQVHKQPSEDGQKTRLYYYSEEHAAKERGMASRFAERFEQITGDRPRNNRGQTTI